MRLISHLLILFVFFTSLNPALAESGETLHETSCIECHSLMTGGDGSVLYSREDRLVQSMAGLEKQVMRCSDGAQTGWSDSQIKSVIGFLNQAHYNF